MPKALGKHQILWSLWENHWSWQQFCCKRFKASVFSELAEDNFFFFFCITGIGEPQNLHPLHRSQRVQEIQLWDHQLAQKRETWGRWYGNRSGSCSNHTCPENPRRHFQDHSVLASFSSYPILRHFSVREVRPMLNNLEGPFYKSHLVWSACYENFFN